MNLRVVLAFLVGLGLVVPLAPAAAQHRVALVIGNGAYENAAELSNTRNDAADITAALEGVGFDVTEGTDLTKTSMDRKIREFADRLSGAEAAVFFYAGHALQVGGVNYLVPIDAQLKTSASLDWEMVRLDLVQRTMERETETNILFLDACRDNPLARNLARAMGTRSGQIGRGLAAAESGFGTLISYSTQPGNVALDGTGRNSPYADALIKHLPAPGKTLSSTLINVRRDVMQQTGGKQVPWEHSAMTGQFFFNPAVESSQLGPSGTGVASTLASSEETKARQEGLSALKKRLAELEANMKNQKQEYASRADEMMMLKEKLARREKALRHREAKLQSERKSALLKPVVPHAENETNSQGVSRSFLASFRAWGVSIADTGSKKLCFAHSSPKTGNRGRAERARAFAYITSWPLDKIRDEISFQFGAPLAKGLPVKLTIGEKVFRLFTKNDKAFVADRETEEAAVAAMKNGRRMAVLASAADGTLIKETYSLLGLTAALQKVADACP